MSILGSRKNCAWEILQDGEEEEEEKGYHNIHDTQMQASTSV